MNRFEACVTMLDSLLTRDVFPDFLLRFGIRRLLRQRLREESRGGLEPDRARLLALVDELRRSPIAIETAAANEQHYEVPTRFYQLCLGPRLKYSSCYYPTGRGCLAEAEEVMLALTCERARIADGQEILELGCGWGSLTLWMAEKHPRARITGVSNSATQKLHIDAECARRGLTNVTIITCDMNRFEPPPSRSGGSPDFQYSSSATPAEDSQKTGGRPSYFASAASTAWSRSRCSST